MKQLLTILLISPLYLFAQTGTEYYSCCQGHNPCIQIYGEGALRAHNCKYHERGCEQGDHLNNRGKTVFTSPITAGISGALVSGLVSSLYNKTEEGAAIGYGVFSLMNLVLKPIKRSRAANMVILGLSTAALAYGGTKLSESYATPTTPTTPAETDKALLKNTAIAFGGGLLLGATFTRKDTKGGTKSTFGKKRFMSDMAFTITGNKIGVIVRL
jgi:hypothetical protein